MRTIICWLPASYPQCRQMGAVILVMISLLAGCGTVSKKEPTEKPRDYLAEVHQSSKCYVSTGNGVREKYLKNTHPTRSLLVRTKRVFKVAGQAQRGHGEINEHLIRPGEKVQVGCEGWGMDTYTGMYAIYRHNVHKVFFLKE